jgi:5S rRNA maturation endonuclease (ribonuclease M5)
MVDIEAILAELENAKNKLVIVEGKKDVAALEALGVDNVVQLYKDPLYKIIEQVAETNREVLILTDLDREGKKLFGRINRELQRRGVKVDNRLRHLLSKTDLGEIEGLCTFLENQEKKTLNR